MKAITFVKRSSLILFLLISSISFSQERTINLGDFNILKVFSGVTLELIRGDEQKIVIIGEKKEGLELEYMSPLEVEKKSLFGTKKVRETFKIVFTIDNKDLWSMKIQTSVAESKDS